MCQTGYDLKREPVATTAQHPSATAVTIDGNTLTLEQLAQVARQGALVHLNPAALEMLNRSRRVVDDIVASEDVVYSINTGFGALSRISIPREDVDLLQLNFVRSHAAGTG